MKSRTVHIAIGFSALFASACVQKPEVAVSKADCDAVIASFSVIPISDQTTLRRAEMLETIKNEQQEKFGKACSRFGGWAEQFETAYGMALRNVSAVDKEPAVEITAVQTDE